MSEEINDISRVKQAHVSACQYMSRMTIATRHTDIQVLTNKQTGRTFLLAGYIQSTDTPNLPV